MTQQNFAPAQAVVWTEIPVRDLTKAAAFYNAVFHYGAVPTMMGPQEVVMFNSEDAGGHLYVGEPSDKGPIPHFLVPGALADAKAATLEAGGQVEGEDVVMPFGAFVYIRDIDGNRIGLFEPAKAA